MSTYEPEEEDDLTTRAGFIKRSRKALVAGVLALVGSFGPAFGVAAADGVLGGGEILTLSIVALGIGVAAFSATWATPNAE